MRFVRRNPVHALALWPLALAALMAGCAHAPNEPAQLSCSQLAAEIRGTEQARRYAVEKQQDPFAFVLPFAAGGTNASAKSAVGDADRWLATLHEASRERGCSRLS